MKLPATPPPWKQVLRDDPAPLWLLTEMPDLDTYPHWDDLVKMTPPDGLTHEQWWARLKGLRHEKAVQLPILTSGAGEPLWYSNTVLLRRQIREVAPEARGADPELANNTLTGNTRDLLSEWTLREEAIASVALAGLQINRSEALIAFDDGSIETIPGGGDALGIYRGLERVFSWGDAELTPADVIELNRMLTGTGQLRTVDNDIADPYGQVWRCAPPAAQIHDRLTRLCQYANRAPADGESPFLSAMTVHWIAVHDQYFAEANNRTARILYYWALLRRGYWLARYLTVSTVMLARGLNYRRTFLLTDTDEGDLTYFFQFSISVLRRAIWQLRARLETELHATRHTHTPLLSVEQELNHRQLKVLESCLAEPRSAFTYDTHAAFWQITFDTARHDLRALGKQGLLVRQENSRVWQAPDDLAQRLNGQAPKTVRLGDAPSTSSTPPEEGTVQRLWRFVRNLQR